MLKQEYDEKYLQGMTRETRVNLTLLTTELIVKTKMVSNEISFTILGFKSFHELIKLQLHEKGEELSSSLDAISNSCF